MEALCGPGGGLYYNYRHYYHGGLVVEGGNWLKGYDNTVDNSHDLASHAFIAW